MQLEAVHFDDLTSVNTGHQFETGLTEDKANESSVEKLNRLTPLIPQARLTLAQDLQDYLTMLPRPTSDRDSSGGDENGATRTFKSILGEINTDMIIACYEQIAKVANRSGEFVKEWLNYQALWDMKMSIVFELLGDAIGKWRTLTTDMKESQGSFDPSQNEKSFGPLLSILVQYQIKLVKKYYVHWHHHWINYYVIFLREATRGKHELEETDFTSLSDSSASCDQQWENCKEAEALLKIIVSI